MYAIVRAKAANIRRDRARHPTKQLSPQGLEAVLSPHSNPAVESEQQGAEETLGKLLAMLRNKVPELTFSAYHKHCLEQKTIQETAVELKLSRHEVSWRVYEAKEVLRAVYELLYSNGGGLDIRSQS